MNTKAKVLSLLFLVAVVYFIFEVVDFKYSRVLKEPIRVTLLTKRRFVIAGHRYFTTIDAEINGPPSAPKNISLNSVDIKSLHQTESGSRVTETFEDKDFGYTIHHGEDPTIFRQSIHQ